MRVLVIQEYVPAYRAKLFLLLQRELSARGVELKVAAGLPHAPQAQRGDLASGAAHTLLKQWHFRVMGRRVSVALPPRMAGEELVILEQARRNLLTYWFILWSYFGGPSIAFWGHGEDVTHKPSKLERGLLRWCTRRGIWFFAYTPSAKEAAMRAGIAEGRITVVMNSTDTTALRERLARARKVAGGKLTDADVSKRQFFAFIGALDDSKRMDILFDAWGEIKRAFPHHELRIAGLGPLSAMVKEKAQSDPRVIPVGRAEGELLASLLAGATAILNPGRVGLVAVDALVAGCPVVTTDLPVHGPEREYLRDQVTCWVTEASAVSFAEGVIEFCSDESKLNEARLAAHEDGRLLSIEGMASRFAQGVVSALSVANGGR